MTLAAAFTPAEAALRQQGITATDLAAILGLNPWEQPVDVWQRKLGLVEKTATSSAAEWGTRLETVVAQKYAEVYSCTLTKPGVLVHPTRPLFRGSPDFIVNESDRVLEVKTARSKDDWGPEESDDIPDHYRLQCELYMSITQLDEADVAVLWHGQEFGIYHLRSDAELINMAMDTAEEWWNTYVIPQIPPPVDGSTSYRDYLQRRFPRDAQPMLQADHELEALALNLKMVRDEIAALEEAEQKTRNAICAKIGEAAGCAGAFGSITWKAPKPSQYVNWEALARKLGATPDMIKQYTEPRHGARRFLFKPLVTKGGNT